MKKYVYAEAKKLIQSICDAAAAGEYDTREKFQTLLSERPDLAVQGYNAFGKIFFWNKASANLYGYGEHAAVNKELFELILPPELRQLARDMVATAQKTGRTPDATACDLLRYNGKQVTVLSGHVMFRWESATSPEFYCINVEIAPFPA